MPEPEAPSSSMSTMDLAVAFTFVTHSVSSPFLPLAPTDSFAALAICVRTALASPHMPRSIGLFLPISAGSMSTDITLTSGAKKLPVPYSSISSNLTPIARRTSAPAMAPKPIPTGPPHSGWSSGMHPFPPIA